MKKMNAHHRYTIGLDEVGRGPLAGPVTVGCVLLPSTYTWGYFKKLTARGIVPPLRDSKKLSASQRRAWMDWVSHEPRIVYSVVSIQAHIIDAKGISAATSTAALTAYTRTLQKATDAPHTLQVRVDYGIVLPQKILYSSHKKGDETYEAIALASIVAKVYRDAFMHRQHALYPEYHFDTHVGYGTKEHYAALRAHGITPLHRHSFLKRLVL
jgi:ribonuclease HII